MTLHFSKSIQLPAALRAAALGLVAIVAVAFLLVGCAVKPYGVNVGASEHHTPTPIGRRRILRFEAVSILSWAIT